jgi:hypothetical protein
MILTHKFTTIFDEDIPLLATEVSTPIEVNDANEYVGMYIVVTGAGAHVTITKELKTYGSVTWDVLTDIDGDLLVIVDDLSVDKKLHTDEGGFHDSLRYRVTGLATNGAATHVTIQVCDGAVAPFEDVIDLAGHLKINNHVKVLRNHSIFPTHWSPEDGAIVYTSPVTLTTSLFPFVVDDANCHVLAIFVRNVAGEETAYFDGFSGHTITSLADVVTLSGAGLTPFLATDTNYYIYITKQYKGYDKPTDTWKVTASESGEGRIKGDYSSPEDGAVTFSDALHLNCVFPAFTCNQTNAAILSLMVEKVDGTQDVYINGQQLGGVNISMHFSADNLIEIAGAGLTPFAVTDVQYYVELRSQEKAYDSIFDAQKNIVLNPGYSHIDEDTINVNPAIDGTYNYYIDMDSYVKLGLQFIIAGGSGAATVTLKGSMQDDGTIPSLCTYAAITNEVINMDNFDSSTTVEDVNGFFGNYKYININIVASTGGANDSSWTIYYRERA